VTMLYSADDLAAFAKKLDPFLHPYAAWQTYSTLEPVEVVDLIVCNLNKRNVSGFDERLKQARKDHSSSSFFGLLSELKVAKLFSETDMAFSFLHTRKTPSPDFCVKTDAGEIYIEVTTFGKHYPALQACEEQLQKIDPRFKFGRRYALETTYEGQQPNKPFPDTKIIQLISERLKAYSGKQLNAHTVPVWGSPSEHTLFGLLIDDEIERLADPHNKNGDDHVSTREFIEEVLDKKKDKNNLKNLRPNVLWVEGFWITEWQTAEMNKVPWDSINWPSEIDALVLTVCGIDSTYSSKSIKFFSMRSDMETSKKDCLIAFFEKLFPNWLASAEVIP
jgi:hypothetical protein